MRGARQARGNTTATQQREAGHTAAGLREPHSVQLWRPPCCSGPDGGLPPQACRQLL